MASLVSIITPSFNRADIIHETAESIFNQTYPHWEWIIVDDGSTDHTWDVLEGYAATDSRVKIARRNREPKGACTCRNIGVENCSGDYLLFLDTDDLLASFCLEQRVRAIEESPEVDFLIFPMLLFKQQPDDLKLLWNIDSSTDDIERIMTGDAVCQGTGTLWKKKSFVGIGMWDEQLMLWQDVELHLRSLLKPMNYKKRLELKPDVFLRISDTSLSRTGFHAYPKFISRLYVFEKTAESIQVRGLIKEYKKALRYMALDLFISAANSAYQREQEIVFKLLHNLELLSRNEEKRLNYYACMRKYKLYKIPFLQKRLLKRAQQLLPDTENTLNKIVYTEPILF